jgi:hypothetical protein
MWWIERSTTGPMTSACAIASFDIYESENDSKRKRGTR